jgi:hypothetical protein
MFGEPHLFQTFVSGAMPWGPVLGAMPWGPQGRPPHVEDRVDVGIEAAVLRADWQTVLTTSGTCSPRSSIVRQHGYAGDLDHLALDPEPADAY